jgi:hypothetical protein
MNASIIWENPGLVLLGILVGVFLILLLPILSAVRRSGEERRETSVRRLEPSVYNDRHDDNSRYDDQRPSGRNYFAREERYADRRRLREEPDDDEPASVSPGNDEERYADRRSSRERLDDEVPATIFGGGASKRKPLRVSAPVRSFWFAIGVCVGAGGLALLWNPPSLSQLTTVMALLDRPGPSPVADQTAPGESNLQERPEAPGTDVSASRAAVEPEVGAMIESFVSGLRGQLPMAVGPGITMVNADFNGNVVALGFTIAQTVDAQDAPKLQSELETRFQTNVCSTPPEPTNIHGLNERGVSFLINYVDLGGKNVAGLTVGPNYCADPA